MTITLHGPWQAWALYIGGGLLAMAGIVMLALLFADLRARFEATLEDGGEDGADIYGAVEGAIIHNRDSL